MRRWGEGLALFCFFWFCFFGLWCVCVGKIKGGGMWGEGGIDGWLASWLAGWLGWMDG